MTDAPKQREVGAGGAQEREFLLERTVHRACTRCLAPGTFSSDPLIRDGYSDEQVAQAIAADPRMSAWRHNLKRGWPQCYVEATDPRHGRAVGDACPCCGLMRPPGEPLEPLKVKGRLVP